MTDPALAAQISAQFDDSTDRPAVWRALDLFLPTHSYLNLGYSRWYQSHLLGKPQRRLVSRVLRELTALSQHRVGPRVLDVGCGRGGAARWIAASYGIEVIGVDLVPYNVQQAVRTQPDSDRHGAFVVGDAARLPFSAGSMNSVISIDSIVYMPAKLAVFGEIGRVLAAGGTGVLTDLVIGNSDVDQHRVSAFTEMWGMAPLLTRESYCSLLEDAGFVVESVIDVSPGSVRRFKKWTWLFLGLVRTPVSRVFARVLEMYGIPLGELVAQVRTAHHVLDSLEHIIVRVKHPS